MGLRRSPQPEADLYVPVLHFGDWRFHPHLPFPHCLHIVLRRGVATPPDNRGFIKTAVNASASPSCRAIGPEPRGRTGVNSGLKVGQCGEKVGLNVGYPVGIE